MEKNSQELRNSLWKKTTSTPNTCRLLTEIKSSIEIKPLRPSLETNYSRLFKEIESEDLLYLFLVTIIQRLHPYTISIQKFNLFINFLSNLF